MKPFPETSLILLEYLVKVWASSYFCRRVLGNPGKKEGLFFLFLFFQKFGLFWANGHFYLPYIVLAFLDHAFLAGTMAAFFPGHQEKKLLAASILTVASTILGDFCASFFSIIFLIFLHLGKGVSEPFLSEEMNLLITWLSIFVMAGTVRWLAGHIGTVFFGKPGKWYFFASVPLFMLTAVIDVADWCASNGILLRGEGSLYHSQLFSHGEICILAALSLSSAGFYLFGMNKIYEEQQKNGRYACQLTAYQMLTEQYGQSEKLRHDLKNHVTALQGLAEEQDWTGMKHYLAAMEERGSFGTSEEATGSPALDALLSQKRKRAKTMGIQWESSIRLPKNCRAFEFDLCILFGNLSDNALEACERVEEGKERFLFIEARMVKRCFLLEVKNSMEAEERGNPAKEDSREPHGIGLLSVKDVVEKYQGTMETEAKGGVFTNVILLPLDLTEI